MRDKTGRATHTGRSATHTGRSTARHRTSVRPPGPISAQDRRGEWDVSWELGEVKAEIPEYAVQDEVCVDPSTTAVLVINMQNDFVKGGGNLLVPDAEATIPAIKRLLDFARGNGMRIAYCQDTHRQGDPEWRTWPEHCREGSWGWEIIGELAPAADDAVVPTASHDAFYSTSLDGLLRGWGITTLVLCGTVANICVQYTASSAVLRSYAVVIPSDAISALEAFDLEASLRQTTFVLAGLLTTVAGIRVVEPATVESTAWAPDVDRGR